MKLRLAVMALAAAILPLAGCETLTQTPNEYGNMAWVATSESGGQIGDDMANLLLYDRASWLSDKPVPNAPWDPSRVYPKGTPYYFRDNP
jgi:hypothetical protein